ncbi:uncharacterized protein LOC124616267 [Schistocerca americana]|uniref:uncharacterized protein LOC124616267 n=1 Tax=Schistocerca americana TaxID=7009 RepID=UPI001F4F3253|nr:uncharacterized protein LOC124616267 [Schistocerca americana]
MTNLEAKEPIKKDRKNSECPLAEFVSSSAPPQRVPFVFLPLEGQIVHPSADIRFAAGTRPVCAVTGSQFLSRGGWSPLKTKDTSEPPFRIFRDEGRTFLQWLGEGALRSRMEGHVLLVRLQCRQPHDAARLPSAADSDSDSAASATPDFSPCVAFRVAGTPREPDSGLSEADGRLGAALGGGSDGGGLSASEYVAIGVCSLLLGLVYVASVLLYLHARRGGGGSSKSGSSSAELGLGAAEPLEPPPVVKRNPLLLQPQARAGRRRRRHEDSDSCCSSARSSDANDDSQGPLSDDERGSVQVTVTSALVHSCRHQCGAELYLCEPALTQEGAGSMERLPQGDVSIVETTEGDGRGGYADADDHLALCAPGSLRGIASGRRKLYFNPAYFEPELLAAPPPAAIEFLTKIREVMAIAKHKMVAKRFSPSLSGIPEEEAAYGGGGAQLAPGAEQAQSASSWPPPGFSLKRENSRRRGCVGCPTCRPMDIPEPPCRACCLEGVEAPNKEVSIRKWLEEVPVPAAVRTQQLAGRDSIQPDSLEVISSSSTSDSRRPPQDQSAETGKSLSNSEQKMSQLSSPRPQHQGVKPKAPLHPNSPQKDDPKATNTKHTESVSNDTTTPTSPLANRQKMVAKLIAETAAKFNKSPAEQRSISKPAPVSPKPVSPKVPDQSVPTPPPLPSLTSCPAPPPMPPVVPPQDKEKRVSTPKRKSPAPMETKHLMDAVIKELVGQRSQETSKAPESQNSQLSGKSTLKSKPSINSSFESDSLERSDTLGVHQIENRGFSTPSDYGDGTLRSCLGSTLRSNLPLEEEMTMRNEVFNVNTGSTTISKLKPKQVTPPEDDHEYEVIMAKDDKKSSNEEKRNARATEFSKVLCNGGGYSLVSEVYVNDGYSYDSGSPSSSPKSRGSTGGPKIRYDEPEKPGHLTIEVEDSPVEYAPGDDSDSFEPDTLDRKPSRQGSTSAGVIEVPAAASHAPVPAECYSDSLERPANILLRTTGSFRGDSASQTGSFDGYTADRIVRGDDEVASFSRGFGSLREIYEARHLYYGLEPAGSDHSAASEPDYYGLAWRRTNGPLFDGLLLNPGSRQARRQRGATSPPPLPPKVLYQQPPPPRPVMPQSLVPPSLPPKNAPSRSIARPPDPARRPLPPLPLQRPGCALPPNTSAGASADSLDSSSPSASSSPSSPSSDCDGYEAFYDEPFAGSLTGTDERNGSTTGNRSHGRSGAQDKNHTTASGGGSTRCSVIRPASSGTDVCHTKDYRGEAAGHRGSCDARRRSSGPRESTRPRKSTADVPRRRRRMLHGPEDSGYLSTDSSECPAHCSAVARAGSRPRCASDADVDGGGGGGGGGGDVASESGAESVATDSFMFGRARPLPSAAGARDSPAQRGRGDRFRHNRRSSAGGGLR